MLAICLLSIATAFPSSSLRDCIETTLAKTIYPTDPDFIKAKQGTFNVASTVYKTTTPFVITYPNVASQIAELIKCANAFNVTVATRSGGHGYESYSLSPGIVIALDNFTEITVDNATSTAIIGAGNWLGRVNWELYAQGKHILPGGICAGVGIGGHALHGGFGYSSRKQAIELTVRYGLVSDAILSLELVTPTGEITRVTHESDPELFFGLRGAGGNNFGIVTSFNFQVFPAPGWLNLTPRCSGFGNILV